MIPRNASASARPPVDLALYPWAQRRLDFASPQDNPFPRYGAAANSKASPTGEIYLMGGLINGSMVKGDLWVVESGSSQLSCRSLQTTAEGPGPRVGHASLLVGNAFIVFGGDTKVEDMDTLDDTLYLLNTSKSTDYPSPLFNFLHPFQLPERGHDHYHKFLALLVDTAIP